MEDREIYNNLLDLRDTLKEIEDNLSNSFNSIAEFSVKVEKFSDSLSQDFCKEASALSDTFIESNKKIRNSRFILDTALANFIEEYYNKIYSNYITIEDWPETTVK